MMIDAALPRFAHERRVRAATRRIKMRVHTRRNSGSDVKQEQTLKYASSQIVSGLFSRPNVAVSESRVWGVGRQIIRC